jgi:DNA repair protein RadC
MEPINNCRAAAALLRDKFHALDHEEVWVLYLTARMHPIGSEMISKGTLTATSIDCRTVLRQALLHNAAALILMHNHPSGDPSPSPNDIRFTKQLRQACSLMDVQLLDHIITADEGFYSFSEETTQPFNI